MYEKLTRKCLFDMASFILNNCSLASNSSQSSIASPLAAPAVSQSGPSNSSPPKMPDMISPQNNVILSQVMTWHLVPPSTNNDTPILPSLIYGATHLARLFGWYFFLPAFPYQIKNKYVIILS